MLFRSPTMTKIKQFCVTAISHITSPLSAILFLSLLVGFSYHIKCYLPALFNRVSSQFLFNIAYHRMKKDSSTDLHAHKTVQGHAPTHTDLQVSPIVTYPCIHAHTLNTHTHASDVFLWSTVTVCVTDLISPTICWLEAQHRRSYPVWQKQTASVYACFSQGLAQYGGVESLSWPPNLHPCTLASKDLEIISRTSRFLDINMFMLLVV